MLKCTGNDTGGHDALPTRPCHCGQSPFQTLPKGRSIKVYQQWSSQEREGKPYQTPSGNGVWMSEKSVGAYFQVSFFFSLLMSLELSI
jgi:hypothetical protein